MRVFYKSSLILMLFLAALVTARAQQNSVAIGTSSANPRAVLLLVGNNQNQGLIIPTVNSPTSIGAQPGDAGMIVYNTTDKLVYYFNGTQWTSLGASGSAAETISISGNTITIGGTGTNQISLANVSGSLAAGQFFMWDGSKWSATTLGQDVTVNGTGQATVAGLLGKQLPSGALPSTLQFLAYDGTTSTWKFQTPSGSLPTLTANQLLSNDGTTTKGVSVGGDLGLSVSGTTGTFTIANGAISLAKLANAPSANQILTSNGTNAPTWVSTLSGSQVMPAFGAQNISTTGTLSSGVTTVTGLTVSGSSTKLNGQTYTWPSSTTAGFLQTDASGNLTWATLSGGGNMSTTTYDINSDGIVDAAASLTTTLPLGKGGTGITTTPILNQVLATDGTGTVTWINQSALTPTFSSQAANTFLSAPNGSAGVPSFRTIVAADIPNLDASKITTGTLPIARGGTGATTAAAALTNLGGLSNPITTTGDIIYGVGSTPTRLAGAAGFLKSTGAAAPAWSSVNLASTDVSNLLPITSGGTGASTAAAALTNLGALSNPMTSTGDLIYGGAAGAVTRLAGGASGILKSNGITPSWGSVGLATTDVSGTLPITSGGTGAITAAAALANLGGLSNPLTTTGDIIYSVGSTPTRLAGAAGFLKSTGAAAPVWSTLVATDIPNLDASKITTGSLPIANGGTGAITAATALTNLGALGTALNSAKIFVGNAGNVATAQNLSGDATLSNAGALTIANGAISGGTAGKIADGTITDADVSLAAAIAGTKISPNFGTQNIVTTGSLGIGTTTPTQSIDVTGAEGKFLVNPYYSGPGATAMMGEFHNTNSHGAQLRFSGAVGGSPYYDIGQDATGNFVIENGGDTPLLNLNNAGAISFGSTPDYGTLNYVLTSQGSGAAPKWLSAGSSGWGLTGNAGTVDGTSFIGTTDAIPLSFRVSNQSAGRIELASGTANTLYGYQSGNVNTGIRNSAFGYQAMLVNSAGQRNAAFGYLALASNTTGNGNTAVGSTALSLNVTGGANAAFGTAALANNTGSNNTAVGNTALSTNTTATDNAAIGTQSLGLTTTGGFNSALGSGSLFNTTGSNNTGVGYYSLVTNTAGNSNTALGYKADVSSNSLTNATAIGAQAYVGANNSLVLGSISGVNGAAANTNVGIGTTTPAQTLDVNGNTLLRGSFVGLGGATSAIGSSGFVVQDDNGPGFGGMYINTPNATGLPFYGYNNGTASCYTYMDGSDGNKWKLNYGLTVTPTGSVGIGTTAPSYLMHVNGSASVNTFNVATTTSGALSSSATFNGGVLFQNQIILNAAQNVTGSVVSTFDNVFDLGASANRWKTVYAGNGTIQTSDIRLKENVRSLNYGLNEVMSLRPVSYTWKKDSTNKVNLGLIAQEVLKVVPEVVNVPKDGGYLGMNYSNLIPVLIKSIQEQQKLIDDQKKQIEELKAKQTQGETSAQFELNQLKAEIANIKKALGMEASAKKK